MANEATKLTVQEFEAQVLPPERKRELFRALPSHVRAEAFERALFSALMQNPDLMLCHPSLVYREVSKAAGSGLLLDPEFGEAYIVCVYNPKSGKRDLPQLRRGYRGLLKLVRQSGEISRCNTRAVYRNDKIDCQLGTDEHLIHTPDLFGERGDVIGFYAVASYRTGDIDFEPMNIEEVKRIRDRADAYKAFVAGKIKSTPWESDFDEMARKTVLRRLCKRLPQSPELQLALSEEDRAELPEPIGVATATATGEAETITARGHLDVIEGMIEHHQEDTLDALGGLRSGDGVRA